MTDTQAIKDRVDIVQLIGEYIQIKKAGANWKANCPFHHEKTPSFMIHPEKQIWHCFGCGKGGDVFSFLHVMEGLYFPEALKILADRAGVKIDTFASEVNKSQRNRIVEINAKAAAFFHNFLSQMSAAKPAMDYLLKRGLAQNIIEEWTIGYIPEQWDLLTQYLLKKGEGIDDLVASGLTIKKEGADISKKKGFYDRFRGRIMFPIWDAHGNVAGFTGRILVETENSGGKYVNTPQTPVFDKSRLLFGLNKAKVEIKNKDLAVLVEGQMDVIACHQAGMKNVVASSGTALTFEQVKMIKRYTNNIAIAFDADAAGQSAAKRGIDVAMEQGMNIKIIQIPEGCGKDADECLKKNSEVWFKAVENAKEVMVWHFDSNLNNINKNDPKQKQRVAEALLSEITKLAHGVEQDHWLKRLAEALGVEFSVLRAEMSKMKVRYKIVANDQKNGVVLPEKSDKSTILAENLWALFLKFPRLAEEFILSLKPGYFINTQFLTLYENVNRQYNESNKIDPELLKGESVDVLLLKGECEYDEFDEKTRKKEAVSLICSLKNEWKKKEKSRLEDFLKKAVAENNAEERARIMSEITKLESENYNSILI